MLWIFLSTIFWMVNFYLQMQKDKVKHGDALSQGKKMPFEVYELMWNIPKIFIIWLEDSFGFYIPKSKTNQFGKRGDAVWHVYTPPGNPAVCPILALDCYLFSFPGILSSKSTCSTTERSKVLWNNISPNSCGKLVPGYSKYDHWLFHDMSSQSNLWPPRWIQAHWGGYWRSWITLSLEGLLQLCCSRDNCCFSYWIYLFVSHVEYRWNKRVLFEFWKG